jgi:hypothetical protein
MNLHHPDLMPRLLRHALVLSLVASPLAAQAYNYPALQLPVLAEREYNFAAASAGKAGTSLYVQWRESAKPAWQLSLDGGLAAPEKGDTRILLAGSVAWQALRSAEELPFDVAFTVGAGFSSGNGKNVVRIPVGASVGHTFELEGGFSLTPFVHPRLSLDRCSTCNAGTSDSKVDVDVDLGVNFEINKQVALRVAALLGGADYLGATNGVGFSLAWTPKGLRK